MQWKISTELVPYPEALRFMEAHVEGMIAGDKKELVWLLEHPALYTAGTSAKESDLLDESRFPIYQAGRGGKYTYHGPGQRIAYVMLDLKKRKPDIRRHVCLLEEWIICTLAELGIKGERRKDRIGIWVIDPSGEEKKIAAVGVRVRHWITYHGISLNVNPNLEHFNGIVPCGIKGYGVTSLEALGMEIPVNRIDRHLQSSFHKVCNS